MSYLNQASHECPRCGDDTLLSWFSERQDPLRSSSRLYCSAKTCFYIEAQYPGRAEEPVSDTIR